MREVKVSEEGVAMNAQEREAFWKTLCSLPGTDPKTESEKLGQTIKYPRFLYRYRSVSSKSLEPINSIFLPRITMMTLLILFFILISMRSAMCFRVSFKLQKG